MDRRLAKLPKVPSDYVHDTAWGHAMYRVKFMKAVRQRMKALRHFGKPAHWFWSKHGTKWLHWDAK